MVRCKQYSIEDGCEHCKVFKHRTVLLCGGDMNKCEIAENRRMAKEVERRRREAQRKKEMEMAQPVKIYAGTVNIDALKLGEWKVSEEELEANKKKMMAIEDSIIAGYLEAVKMTCERSECGTCKFARLCKTAPKSWDWQTMQKAIDTAREEAEAEIRRQEGNT